MKKNILVPIEYIETVAYLNEDGNEVTEEVTKVRYEARNVDMTAEEEAEIEAQSQAEASRQEAEFWAMSYSDRVSHLIRQKYSLDDELAISRQRDTKAEEFAEYFAYCEQCKARAREVGV